MSRGWGGGVHIGLKLPPSKSRLLCRPLLVNQLPSPPLPAWEDEHPSSTSLFFPRIFFFFFFDILLCHAIIHALASTQAPGPLLVLPPLPRPPPLLPSPPPPRPLPSLITIPLKPLLLSANDHVLLVPSALLLFYFEDSSPTQPLHPPLPLPPPGLCPSSGASNWPSISAPLGVWVFTRGLMVG